ncbi:hypothetical protein JVU11DRAFT_2168 [Chiua virens]|nr:hypothetical protein JVU11DRAFT_2168 [Chiua virens]
MWKLNSWYAEDCERLAILQQLRLLNMFVVGSVGLPYSRDGGNWGSGVWHQINIGKAVKHKPSNQRMEAWHKQTGMYFNPFEAMASTDNAVKQLECPRCRTTLYVPFMNDSGTGFAEANFSFTCPLPGCRLQVTHDNLAVAKFVRDLSEGDGTREHLVSGSLFNPLGKRDAGHAKVIKDQLMHSPYFAGLRPSALDERLDRLDRVKELKEKIGYSLDGLKEAISTSLRNCPAAWVTRILSAYSSGSPFSVDLVDAVLRQCQFTMQLEQLGWLKPGAFRKREVLDHSIMRYHAFLDLMAVHPSSMFVPTLDIDLIWHTHQLMANRYSIDCEMYVGRNVDHEMSVIDSRLSSAFDGTCRAWKASGT